jgi:tetratricopeptide (TPR) repeat protein
MRLIITCVILAALAYVGYVIYGAVHPYILNGQAVVAVSLEKKDPDAADRAFCKLIQDLKNSPGDWGDAGLCSIYGQYGDFIFECGRHSEALKIFNDGEELSKKIGNTLYEAGFLWRRAFDQHYLFEAGNGNPPDPEQVFRAMKLSPDDVSHPTSLRANCYKSLGLAYMDRKEYEKADEYFQKSKADYESLKDAGGDILDLQLFRILNLIKQKKYAEANKVFIEAWETTGDDWKCQLKSEYLGYLRGVNPQWQEIVAQNQKSLADRNFAELDARAEKLTAEGGRMPSGHWSLDLYFETLDNLKPEYFNSIWEKRIDTLKQWQKANPDSAAAPVARASCLTSYAWRARGGGWADSVSADGWRLFHDRLQEAASVLAQSKHKNPRWYLISQRVALGQGWDRDKYDALVGECRKQYPTYYPTIFAKAYFILPKWHGEPGELVKYAGEEARAVTGADGGDVLYARIAWSLADQNPPTLASQNMSWPRIKSGLETLKKRFPTSPIVSGTLSVIALEYGKKAVAENAFK